MSRRAEALTYGASVIILYALAVVPHALEYGWAWGWPGAGLGFPIALLGSACAIPAGVAAVVCVLVRPKQPRIALLLRIVAIPVIVVGPGIVFDHFGGLATSEGRGLAARVRDVTPVESLQRWAVGVLHGSKDAPLPAEVASTLPQRPRIQCRGDHVVLSWYDRGLFIGPPEFRPSHKSFFEAQIRPGVYVYVVEH